jgi:predicted ATPase/DNA-binding SARP family transcriptional activator
MGPLEVFGDDGGLLPMGPPRQRAVLAVLIRNVGRVIAIEHLIDAVYGTEPPASAWNAVQVYVSALRKVLGRDRLSHRPPGYLLVAEPEETDLGRFDRLLAEGRLARARGDLERSVELHRQAQLLVRGKPFADLGDLDFAVRASVAIQERIDESMHQRIDVELSLGRHATLLPELIRLLDDRPFDERLCGQLMLALYRSGRQSDALDRFRQTRERLAEELGVDPSHDLVGLQEAILRQETALDLPQPLVWRHPPPPAPLLGREQDLAAIETALTDPDTRLVTLTGPGGGGKTHLAMAAAHALTERYEAGSVFVPLAPLTGGEFLPAALAAALDLDVEETSERGIVRAVATALSGRQLLVVLDNFEHLVARADLVSEMLDAAAGLTLLVTSRVPLRIRREHVYPVGPLALPLGSSIEEIRAAASVRLFEARARGVQPGFAVTASNGATVASICLRLDGLPLALELAAGRVRLLDLPELLSRLERRLATLVGGARDLPERQQTLRATLDWSYQLLSEDARRLFARVSLLAGGGTIAAVEKLSGDGTTLELAELLVDAGLLVRQEGEYGNRLRMLETIREYASEKLTGSSDEAEAYRLLAGYLIAAFSGPRDEGTQVALAALDDDFHTVRACLPWLFTHEPQLAASLVGATENYVRYRALTHEGRSWCETAASAAGLDPTLRYQLLYGAGDLALDDSDLDAADQALGEALTIARQLTDPDRIARTLIALAWAHLYRGMLTEAESAANEAAKIAKETRNGIRESKALSVAGCAAAELGEHQRAAEILSRAIDVCPPDAIGTLTECHTNLSFMRVLSGDAAAGYEIGKVGLEMGRRENHFLLTLDSLEHLGWAALLTARLDEAAELWREALLSRRAAHHDQGFEFALWGMSALTAARGDHRAAATLAGAAQSREAARTAAMEQVVTGHLASVRAGLGDRDFNQAFQRGTTLTLDTALAVALSATG